MPDLSTSSDNEHVSLTLSELDTVAKGLAEASERDQLAHELAEALRCTQLYSECPRLGAAFRLADGDLLDQRLHEVQVLAGRAAGTGMDTRLMQAIDPSLWRRAGAEPRVEIGVPGASVSLGLGAFDDAVRARELLRR